MKIAFSEILSRETRYEIIDDGWFPHEDIELENPVDGYVAVRQESDTVVVVTGLLSACVIVACSRCGQPTSIELTAEFMYNCMVGQEESRARLEAECRDEDFYRLYLEEPVVDTDDILREQVYLAIPVAVLCQRSCKGLCCHCGIDLNTGECICRTKDSPSPFAVLQRLKGK